MNETKKSSKASSAIQREQEIGRSYRFLEEVWNQMSGESSGATKRAGFIVGLRGVRYQVKDIERSVAFYTHLLGFKLDHQNPPAFAQVSVGDLKLILSGPGASGSRPNARRSFPGTWRLESSDTSSDRFTCPNPRVEVRRSAFSEPDGRRAGREANPIGRSRRQSARAIRTG